MSIIYQGYKWVGGFDNAGGLIAIEDDVPRFQGKPCYVHSLGTWSDGIASYRADGAVVALGDPTFDLIADIMSDVQYNYIQAAYTPGGTGLSAEMTVRTRYGNSGAPDYLPVFANVNAILQLPQKADIGQDRIWNAYRRVALHFIVRDVL